MTHYVAIIEDAGSDRAVGVWFPDLPGCFAAGDTVDEALENAPEAIQLYADALAKDGRDLPAPRRLDALRSDPAFVSEANGHMIALVELPRAAHAAE
jgi:predicted RNase H-like HicB family nuclease